MDTEPERVDRWLWAARLVKTRALAHEAAAGGLVHVNGTRAKPAKPVGPGDEVRVTVGQVRRTVVVRGTALRRGPAPEARELYEETSESIAERERRAEAHRLSPPPQRAGGARPTKRDRRRMDRGGGRGGR